MDFRILKYGSDELDKEEKNSLLKEADADPQLKDELIAVRQVHSLMACLKREGDTAEGKREWNRFRVTCRRKRLRKVGTIGLRYAAVALCGSLLTWWLTYTRTHEVPVVAEASVQTLVVPAGQRARITLPDGTNVWVNAKSTLTYPSVFQGVRNVSIDGEALFEVAKGEAPFIVNTGKIDIKAVGTLFNVFNYRNEKLSIALLEGKVKVYKPGNEAQGTLMNPDYTLVQTDSNDYRIERMKNNPVLWKDGIYAFNNERMRDIIRKLELYFDVEITVKDPSIYKKQYTGKFRQSDGVIEVLRIIQKINKFNIRKVENTNKIILYRSS